MKKKVIGAIIATFIGLMFAIGASARAAEATISCSAGDSGRCFKVEDSGDWAPTYICSWTGRQADNCTWVHIASRYILMLL